MKHEVFFLGLTIDQKARRDGREARGNEEKEKRGLRKRLEFLDPTLRCSQCFFKSSGYDKLELKHQNLVFTSL